MKKELTMRDITEMAAKYGYSVLALRNMIKDGRALGCGSLICEEHVRTHDFIRRESKRVSSEVQSVRAMKKELEKEVQKQINKNKRQ